MNDKKQVRLLKRGDEKALEEIILTYTNYVATVIINQLKGLYDTETVEELTSDVFFSLWKNRTMTARMAPSWITTSNMLPNSSETFRVMNSLSNIRWPVDDTGSHSVTPSTMPKRMAFRISNRWIIRNAPFQFQFVEQFDSRSGAAAPIASPGEKLSSNVQRHLMTEVECGREPAMQNSAQTCRKAPVLHVIARPLGRGNLLVQPAETDPGNGPCTGGLPRRRLWAAPTTR